MVTEENVAKIRKITDFSKLDSLDEQWNTIVEKSSKNPFLLSEFIKQALEHIPEKWTPLILIISKGKNIIGIAPLKIRFSFFDRRVDFLKPYYCSDFIFDKEYREVCINLTFEFLFKNLRCNHIHFVFPHDSPYLHLLERYCKKKKIHLQIYFEKGRRIIPIYSSWYKYLELRPRLFRKNMRRTIRFLDKAGSWKLICIEGNKQEVSKKIFDIEKKSWKEIWRSRSGFKDWSLQLILNSIKQLSPKVQTLKLRTWFLELEEKTIAYVLGIMYKDLTFLTKTSYDNQFRKLSPGIIGQFLAVQQLFEENQCKYIDFLSDLDYMRYWTKTCFPRIGVVISKGILPTFLLVLKQKFIFCIRSSPFLMKQVDFPPSEGILARMFNVIRKRFL